MERESPKENEMKHVDPWPLEQELPDPPLPVRVRRLAVELQNRKIDGKSFDVESIERVIRRSMKCSVEGCNFIASYCPGHVYLASCAESEKL